MALNLYCGKPGSGKSYSVVEYVVIPALLKGRHVVTNIPLQGELLMEVYGGKVTQLDLDALDHPELPSLIPNGAVAVIDECWNRWPSGQRVSAAPKQDLHWLKEHRHRVDSDGNAMQVILVTQDPSDLASWVRKLIAHSFHMQKLEELGASNRFGINVYQGCPTGDNIPKRFLIRKATGSYKPEIYQYYSSATQSDTTNVGDEKAMDKRFNIWKSGSMIAIMVFVPLAFGFGLYLLNYFTGMADRAKAADKSHRLEAPALQPLPVQLTAAAPAPTTEPVQPKAKPVNELPAVPAASPYWRIAGYLKRSKEPRDKHWPSVTGYGAVEDGEGDSKMQPQAILQGMTGIRYFPLDRCKAFEDGVNYYCDVDGERVTPWSGKQAITDNFKGTAGAAPASVDGEQSESGTDQAQRDSSRSGNRLTVVADTSVTPRTLTDTGAAASTP